MEESASDSSQKLESSLSPPALVEQIGKGTWVHYYYSNCSPSVMLYIQRKNEEKRKGHFLVATFQALSAHRDQLRKVCWSLNKDSDQVVSPPQLPFARHTKIYKHIQRQRQRQTKISSTLSDYNCSSPDIQGRHTKGLNKKYIQNLRMHNENHVPFDNVFNDRKQRLSNISGTAKYGIRWKSGSRPIYLDCQLSLLS